MATIQRNVYQLTPPDLRNRQYAIDYIGPHSATEFVYNGEIHKYPMNCEHPQIRENLFKELRRVRDHFTPIHRMTPREKEVRKYIIQRMSKEYQVGEVDGVFLQIAKMILEFFQYIARNDHARL